MSVTLRMVCDFLRILVNSLLELELQGAAMLCVDIAKMA